MAAVTSLASQTQTIPAATTAAIKWTTEYTDKHKLHDDDGYSIVVNETYWAICAATFDITGLQSGAAIDAVWTRFESDGKGDWKPKDDAWHNTYRADPTGRIVDEIGGQFGLNKSVQLRLQIFNPNDYPITLNSAKGKITLLRY